MLRGIQQDSYDFKAVALPCRAAVQALLAVEDTVIDEALRMIAQSLRDDSAKLLTANQKDLSAAHDLSPAMRERLILNDEKITGMAQAMFDITLLPHPAGKILETWQRPNGLVIEKTAVPIGVLGMIYESRPNVTLDAAALCLKSRNAVILRGGSEALHTNKTLHAMIVSALKAHGIPEAAVTFIDNTDRAVVGDMLNAAGLIDIIIPRGGKGLTGRVMNDAKMPVFAHLDGNCHVYVHESARPDIALSVTLNAKLRRTGICGAAESLLIDKNYTHAHDIVKALLHEGCAIAGDAWARSVDPRVTAATEEDWRSEYLDKKISIKRVHNVSEAIHHINQYGSHHTDAIIATDGETVKQFMRDVDSAIVLHNASTQFADGGEFGFGAEIGIGTGKLHARGPVGLKQLCTFKYVVRGSGQIRA